ncbi:MAG: S-methyl thiohydantoin desulfurase domain-containing protein [Thermoanaerobaculia bacterium]
MSTLITQQNVVQLVSGACFFGAGGGGALATGQGFANAIPAGATIPLVTAQEAASDADHSTGIIIYLGAPTQAASITDAAALAAFDALNAWATQLGKPIGYLVPGEMGAVNATLPFLIAQQRGLAVIDGDGGGGRSLPVLPLASPSCFGVSTSPAMTATSSGIVTQVNAADPYVCEDLIIALNTAPEFEGFAGVGLWLMAPQQVVAAIPSTGTVTRSISYGQVLTSDAPNKVEQIFAMLQQDVPVYRVWRGVLESVSEQVSGGFDVGTVNVRLGDGTLLTVVNQNENIVMWSSGDSAPIVLMPDSVDYLSANGDAFSNVEAPTYVNQSIYVIGIQAPLWMQHNPLAQRAVQKTLAFVGYYGPYVPLQGGPPVVAASPHARLPFR